MRLSILMKKLTKYFLIITLLAVPLVTFSACQDFGYPQTTTPPEEQQPEVVKPATVITTKDAAILAVYQRLLSQAASYEAKIYLSDFYAICDNWSAVSEYFKDGSATWYVVVDMTEVEEWNFRPYWRQASWFVFRDGKVIPSNLFQANALRIEADLQALSPNAAPEPEDGNET